MGGLGINGHIATREHIWTVLHPNPGEREGRDSVQCQNLSPGPHAQVTRKAAVVARRRRITSEMIFRVMPVKGLLLTYQIWL